MAAEKPRRRGSFTKGEGIALVPHGGVVSTLARTLKFTETPVRQSR